MTLKLMPDDRTPLDGDRSVRLMVESIVDFALFMLDEHGYIVSWNAGAERITGYSSTEIIGRHTSVFHLAKAIEQNAPAGELKVAASIGRFEEEGWRVCKNGSNFWANTTITAVRDCAGQLIGFANLTRDLTERRTAQAALRRSEARFQQVVEAAPNAIVLVDVTGQIEMINTEAERLFGYPRGEILGKSIEMLVPRFRDRHSIARAEFCVGPASRPMGEIGHTLFGRRKDGSEFPVEIGLNSIETESGTMVLSAIADISARERQEERFRQVVEFAPSAMVMINVAGQIEMVNALTESVFGYSRRELLGRSVDMLVPERFRGNEPTLRTFFFAETCARPVGAGHEQVGLRKDGTEFPFEIGLNPIETEEGPMVLSAIVDISDRKQKERRVIAALKEKDILLAEVHHRVKNNLQIIYSLLDLQSARIHDEVALELLKDSQNRIKSMALIHQTLYQSKNFVEVDFRNFIDTLVPSLVSSYGLNSERVALTIEPIVVRLPIDCAIPCGLIVSELISNALKHAFPAGRRGEIRVGMSYDEAGWSVLRVSDDGIGIPADVEFSHAATLGLQLVKLLSDQLQGDLTVERANPTRFALRFPVQK